MSQLATSLLPLILQFFPPPTLCVLMPHVNWKARRCTVHMQSTPLCAQRKQQSRLQAGVVRGCHGNTWWVSGFMQHVPGGQEHGGRTSFVKCIGVKGNVVGYFHTAESE